MPKNYVFSFGGGSECRRELQLRARTSRHSSLDKGFRKTFATSGDRFRHWAEYSKQAGMVISVLQMGQFPIDPSWSMSMANL